MQRLQWVNRCISRPSRRHIVHLELPSVFLSVAPGWVPVVVKIDHLSSCRHMSERPFTPSEVTTSSNSFSNLCRSRSSRSSITSQQYFHPRRSTSSRSYLSFQRHHPSGVIYSPRFRLHHKPEVLGNDHRDLRLQSRQSPSPMFKTCNALA